MNTVVMREVILISIVVLVILIILVIHKLTYRKLLTRKVKKSLEEMVFIHNGIFLKNGIEGDSESEKEEALKKIEDIVKVLGENLEKYEKHEIKKEKLELALNKSQTFWDRLFTMYPWVYKYDLYDGGAVSYAEHVSTYRHVKKKARKIKKEGRCKKN
ncbi:hypothetical protein [uncultured Clostridium sp.]|uniref:hypothetical protein n=1 Tax=uncultured Clostridium sp. TaxID=59620 RepID=UPI00261EF9BB|nr:hypothetical protein [uncultured Clostridium sp.]